MSRLQLIVEELIPTILIYCSTQLKQDSPVIELLNKPKDEVLNNLPEIIDIITTPYNPRKSLLTYLLDISNKLTPIVNKTTQPNEAELSLLNQTLLSLLSTIKLLLNTGHGTTTDICYEGRVEKMKGLYVGTINPYRYLTAKLSENLSRAGNTVYNHIFKKSGLALDSSIDQIELKVQELISEHMLEKEQQIVHPLGETISLAEFKLLQDENERLKCELAILAQKISVLELQVSGSEYMGRHPLTLDTRYGTFFPNMRLNLAKDRILRQTQPEASSSNAQR